MRGFSIIELLIVLALVAGLVGVGLPHLMATEAQQQLQRLMQKQLGLLQQARALALKHQQPVTVGWYGAGDTWCVRMDFIAAGDCLTTPENAVLNHVDAPAVRLANVHFAKGNWTAFDGELGLSQGVGGSVSFAVEDLEIKLISSSLGRFRLCVVMGQWRGYPACS